MLVYDITNEKSFDNIRNWIRNIEEVQHQFISVPSFYPSPFFFLFSNGNGSVISKLNNERSEPLILFKPPTGVQLTIT